MSQRISKFLSLVLRHKPDTIGLNLDKNGWADIEELLSLARENAKIDLDYGTLAQVVAQSDKQRFKISPDGQKIRANQGHSISVDLELSQSIPPDVLFHGTASRFLENIRVPGLKAMQRNYVHLSASRETAQVVGRRHGSPVAILVVDSRSMVADGYRFFRSDNGVWLTSDVPASYIKFPDA
ncbi:MAG: RNA 2'-phosphotransferase [Leptospirales bacterium]|nr:RNA 2'-phosphotransferase [Leptospirales bacterium]